MTSRAIERLLRSEAVQGMIAAVAHRVGIHDGVGYLTGDDVQAELTLVTIEAARAFKRRRGSKFTTYLWPRLYGQAVDLRRRHGRQSRSGEQRPIEAPIDYAANVPAAAPAPEEGWDLIEMIGRLPARERSAFLMHDLGGEAAKAVASTLGLSRARAKLLRRRAVRRLKVGLPAR